MSTHNICFHGEIRKISMLFGWKKAPYLEWSECIKALAAIHKLQHTIFFKQEEYGIAMKPIIIVKGYCKLKRNLEIQVPRSSICLIILKIFIFVCATVKNVCLC